MGDALLVSPVLHHSANTTDAYFPGGTVWYSLYDGTPIDTTSGGKVVTLEVRPSGFTSRRPYHAKAPCKRHETIECNVPNALCLFVCSFLIRHSKVVCVF